MLSNYRYRQQISGTVRINSLPAGGYSTCNSDEIECCVSAIQEQAAQAQKKRDDILKAAEARSKHLLSKHLVKEAQTRAKELARLEKLKESAKEKKVLACTFYCMCDFLAVLQPLS